MSIKDIISIKVALGLSNLSGFSLMVMEDMYLRLQGKLQFFQINQLLWFPLLLILLREKTDLEMSFFKQRVIFTSFWKELWHPDSYI